MRTKYFLLRSTALSAVSMIALLNQSGLFVTPAHAQAVQLPGVTIYSTTPQLPASGAGVATGGDLAQPASPAATVEDPESPARPPVIGDSGEFLRHVNGVDAARMGGHGLDPVIRGLDQNQLGITNDGAYHFGGCPNRMDPPTSHMQLYTYDKVTVKKGYQSVLDGPPAPGGSIQFERLNPTFAPGMDVSTNFKAGGGYNSNGIGKEAFVDMSMGNDWGYVRGFGSYGSAENYTDGDGNKIRSSFDQFGGGGILARTFDRDSFISLKVENNNVDDVLYPGSGMDAPRTDDWTYQLKGETDLDWGIIKGVKSDVYLTTVDHVMNTFDLRTPPAAPNPWMEARTESDTLGGKLIFNGAIGGSTFDLGTDYRDVMRDGTRYSGANGNYDPSTSQSFLWADTSIKEWALFGESVVPLSAATKMTLGMRFAHVDASIANAYDEPAASGTQRPASLYNSFYGTTDFDQTENNVSGLVRLEQELAPGLTLFGTASRSVRTADSTERYMASFSGSASWVGNPDLDPEKHHQVDVGMTYRSGPLDIKGSVYHNRVTDFIQLYSGQNIGGSFTNVSLYRNIDASLSGVEAEAELRLTNVWRVTLAGAYTYGQNLTDDTALGQVAPLSGRLELIYDDTKYLGGVRLNAQADQNRVDTDSSKQDFGETEGWATVDLFAAYNVSENFQLSAGVTNVFDTAYANHLNKKDALGGSYQVNEPGRSFYIRGVSKF